MLGGVCGGIAEYFGVDPALVRIIAILLIIAGGGAIFAYILAWLIILEEPGEEESERETRREPNRWALAVFLIVIGALWLSQYFFFPPWAGIAFVSLLLIVGGVLLFPSFLERWTEEVYKRRRPHWSLGRGALGVPERHWTF
jgi:phage shock protein C